MKQIPLLILICTLSANLFSQYEAPEAESQPQPEPLEKTKCITLGVLQGGGSLLGIDFEALLTKRIGVQAGVGLLGYGAGINYHLKPSVRSSFFSLQYWHQGVGPTFTQSLIGPNFVYRGRKWFTCQIGLGFPLKKGPGFAEDYQLPPVMLTYAVGAYIPF